MIVLMIGRVGKHGLKRILLHKILHKPIALEDVFITLTPTNNNYTIFGGFTT